MHAAHPWRGDRYPIHLTGPSNLNDARKAFPTDRVDL